MLFGELNLIYCSNNNNIKTSSPKKDNYIVMGYNTWLSMGKNLYLIELNCYNANKIKNDSVIIFPSFEDLMV